MDVVGIIHRIGRKGAEIDGFNAFCLQVFGDGFFVFHPGVVASQCYFHGLNVFLCFTKVLLISRLRYGNSIK